MVASRAATVKEYLSELEPDRAKEVESIRKLIRKSLSKGFVEEMQYGMISYVVPLSVKPDTYNGRPLNCVGLASQKHGLSLYLSLLYIDPSRLEKFEEAYALSGKKISRGKGCLRFKSLDDIPWDVIASLLASVSVEEFSSLHDAIHSQAKAPSKKRSARQS